MEMKKYWILAAIFGWCISQVYVLEIYADNSSGDSAAAGSKAALAQRQKDYVGSKICLKCHEQHYKGWKCLLFPRDRIRQ